jgi:hypothetical protein
MEIKLIDPECGKNFSVQFLNCTESEMKDIKRFSIIYVPNCPVFLQGFDVYSGWAMIEFWTDNVDLMIEYCEGVKQYFNQDVIGL